MTAGRSASLCWSLLSACILLVSADQKNLTAEPGQNVTLPCRGPNNKTCVVEWIRTDLGKEYVFFYRERRIVTDRQHPSFVNRVDLQDRRLKDGEVSVVLQNVTINDTGRYECRVVLCRSLQNSYIKGNPIGVVYLTVDPPGQAVERSNAGKNEEVGSAGLIIGLSVSALLLVAAVGFLMYRCNNQQSRDSYQPPVEMQPV
ncbi:uncharacterized protein LOC115796972 [Archocentrus centrarchus]|uniref:uncharacterized protein LOC115796972 n=1 Tax=Archocentrus centrarchus TaxID=63155 RepID=UPI0011EA353B|nr:uncharacterized protein LOC115796972 [Archocentrus centrarchus]